MGSRLSCIFHAHHRVQQIGRKETADCCLFYKPGVCWKQAGSDRPRWKLSLCTSSCHSSHIWFVVKLELFWKMMIIHQCPCIKNKDVAHIMRIRWGKNGKKIAGKLDWFRNRLKNILSESYEGRANQHPSFWGERGRSFGRSLAVSVYRCVVSGWKRWKKSIFPWFGCDICPIAFPAFV